MLPLPKHDGRERAVPDLRTANAGLVWDKFVDGWHFNAKNEFGLHDKKGEWVKRFCGKDVLSGRQGELRQACSRLAKLSEARTVAVFKRVPDEAEMPKLFVSAARLVTGLGQTHPVENGFRWHHGLGVPYLPASGVKGMIRAWAQDWEAAEEEEIDRLFGTNDAIGALIVFDALPVEPPQLVHEVLTPHDGGWRLNGPQKKKTKDANNNVTEYLLSPGDWHDPVPVPFLAVEMGARFLFALAPTRNAGESDLQRGYAILADALAMIGAGAKTASGFGLFQPASASHAEALERQIKPHDKMTVAEGHSNRKWAGAQVTVARLHQNGLIGVVRGPLWNGKEAQIYIAAADLAWLDDD